MKVVIHPSVPVTPQNLARIASNLPEQDHGLPSLGQATACPDSPVFFFAVMPRFKSMLCFLRSPDLAVRVVPTSGGNAVALSAAGRHIWFLPHAEAAIDVADALNVQPCLGIVPMVSADCCARLAEEVMRLSPQQWVSAVAQVAACFAAFEQQPLVDERPDTPNLRAVTSMLPTEQLKKIVAASGVRAVEANGKTFLLPWVPSRLGLEPDWVVLFDRAKVEWTGGADIRDERFVSVSAGGQTQPGRGGSKPATLRG